MGWGCVGGFLDYRLDSCHPQAALARLSGRALLGASGLVRGLPPPRLDAGQAGDWSTRRTARARTHTHIEGRIYTRNNPNRFPQPILEDLLADIGPRSTVQ